MMTNRIEQTFSTLKSQNRTAFIPYIAAGDPDYDTSLALLKALPEAGADLIEIGMPFSDPMADGPHVQAACKRALNAGATMEKTLEMVRAFRKENQDTPIILMGYYNPIHHYGTEQFVKDAAEAGIDGLIIVDLPPEEDAELREPAQAAGIDMIRLVTPTTDEERLRIILNGAGGFIYTVSITGVTGAGGAAIEDIRNSVSMIRKHTDLPVAVGFGIKTPEDVANIASFADGAVVGSAIVTTVKDGGDVVEQVRALSGAT